MKILYTLLISSTLIGSAHAYQCPPFGPGHNVAGQAFTQGSVPYNGSTWNAQRPINIDPNNIASWDAPGSSPCSVYSPGSDCCTYQDSSGKYGILYIQ
mgnify:CR=1 FL=1